MPARPNRNPKERFAALIEVNDSVKLHYIAEVRGCTVNAVIREAVKYYLESGA